MYWLQILRSAALSITTCRPLVRHKGSREIGGVVRSKEVLDASAVRGPWVAFSNPRDSTGNSQSQLQARTVNVSSLEGGFV
jgi:hypothetical protein